MSAGRDEIVRTINNVTGTTRELADLIGISVSGVEKRLAAIRAGKKTEAEFFRPAGGGSKPRIWTVGDVTGPTKLFIEILGLSPTSVRNRLLVFEAGGLSVEEFFRPPKKEVKVKGVKDSGNEEWDGLSNRCRSWNLTKIPELSPFERSMIKKKGYGNACPGSHWRLGCLSAVIVQHCSTLFNFDKKGWWW